MLGRFVDDRPPGFTLTASVVCDFSCALDHEQCLVAIHRDGLKNDSPELIGRGAVVIPRAMEWNRAIYRQARAVSREAALSFQGWRTIAPQVRVWPTKTSGRW